MKTGVKPRPAFERAFDKFLVGDGCWPWIAASDGHGYGVIGLPGKKVGKATRVVYEWLVGPIPAGLELDHLCRNPICVRPDHLEPVTHLENVRRGLSGARCRAKTHCPQGHAYDETNTYRFPDGRRACRVCMRASRERYEERKRDEP